MQSDADLRLAALGLSVQWARAGDVDRVLAVGESFYDFIVTNRLRYLHVQPGQVFDQDAGKPLRKGTLPMQLHDTEKVDLVIQALDSKGFPTADTVTATSSDDTVASVVPGADGKTFTVVAGNPGSAVITLGDGNLSATESIDVIPGAVAKIVIAEGTAVPQ